MGYMNEKEYKRSLTRQIFDNLGENFFTEHDPGTAVTDSEIAADALYETLFNLGLNSFYDRTDSINENGIWTAKFTVK